MPTCGRFTQSIKASISLRVYSSIRHCIPTTSSAALNTEIFVVQIHLILQTPFQNECLVYHFRSFHGMLIRHTRKFIYFNSFYFF
jgi:hypothetical protein